jgi:hypothetical protein
MLTTNQTHLARLDASTDSDDESALAGEEFTTNVYGIEINIAGGYLLALLDAEVDLEHDGIGWEITGIAYSGEYSRLGDDKPSFDVQRVRDRQLANEFSPREFSLTDQVEHAILAAVTKDYNKLVNEAYAHVGK